MEAAGEAAADASVRDRAVGVQAPLRGSGHRPVVPGDGRRGEVHRRGGKGRAAEDPDDDRSRGGVAAVHDAGEGGVRVRTVEHLLSALEACGIDNCGIEIRGVEEVPLLDGSAKGWVEAVEHFGLCVAKDSSGGNKEKMAPVLQNPKYVWRGDSFIIAFPSSKIHITCGINFPQAPAIGWQWFSCFMDDTMYSKEIASSRTFCIYEQVEMLRKDGLIQGGSTENAIVCSATAGWLNPPLRFDDEPCRHKVLDLVGGFSLFARNGNQGLPLAHIIAYKAGHSLHAEFLRRLSSQPGTGAEHAHLQLTTTRKRIQKERGKGSCAHNIYAQKIFSLR